MKSSFNIAKSTYVWMWFHKFLILKFTLPILFISLISVYFNTLPVIIISVLVGSYYMATVMVQIHRTIILSVSADHIKMFPKIEKTFFLYIGVWFFLNAIENIHEKIMVKMPFDSTVSILIEITFGLIFAYVITRAYLIFPIMAVKNRVDFHSAFLLSKKNFWTIFNSNLLLILPLIVLLTVVIASLFLVFSSLNSDYNWAMAGFVGLYFLIFTAINIHYSLLFLELDKDQNDIVRGVDGRW